MNIKDKERKSITSYTFDGYTLRQIEELHKQTLLKKTTIMELLIANATPLSITRLLNKTVRKKTCNKSSSNNKIKSK